METLTSDKLLITACVLLVLINAYNAIMSGVKNARDEKKYKNAPTHQLEEKMKSHDLMLANDKIRLDRMQDEMNSVRDGQRVMMRGVQALLHHELHNGNSQQMQDASDDIDQFFIKMI